MVWLVDHSDAGIDSIYPYRLSFMAGPTRRGITNKLMRERQQKKRLTNPKRTEYIGILIVAAFVILGLTSGGDVHASGHEHMHDEDQWRLLFDKLIEFIVTSVTMLLTGFFAFRAVIWPEESQSETKHTIGRLEQGAAMVTLFVLIITGSIDKLTFLKAAVAIFWVLTLWSTSGDYRRLFIFFQAMCSIVIVSLLHIGKNDVVVSISSLIAISSEIIHTIAVSIWFGGGIMVYVLMSQKIDLPKRHIELILARFMKWCLAVWSIMVLTNFVDLSFNTDAITEWIRVPRGTLQILKLLLIVAVAWVMTKGYTYWKKTTHEQDTRRFHYRQCLRFSLNLTILLLIISIFLPSPLPSKGILKEPIYWHVMGEDSHMSLRIREHNDDIQDIQLDIWLPSGTGTPIAAEIILRHAERTTLVPMSFAEGGPDPYGFAGFDKFTYNSRGSYLTANGAWTIEVTVTDAANVQHVYEKAERLP